MNSEFARMALEAAVMRAASRDRGVLPARWPRTAAARLAELSVPDLMRLPVMLQDSAGSYLQNSAGQLLFLPGYSAVGKGDVIG